MKEAAENAMEREAQKQAGSCVVDEAIVKDSDLIAASNVVEQAYKLMYQRIQDVPDKDLSWKNEVLDKLDLVCLNF